MNLPKLSLDGIQGVPQGELELRPGLNLLWAPTEATRQALLTAVVRAVRALPAKREGAFEDTHLFGAAQLGEFAKMARELGGARAVRASGKLGAWRWPRVMEGLRVEALQTGSEQGAGPKLRAVQDALGEVQRELKGIEEQLAQAPKLSAELQWLEAELREVERTEAALGEELSSRLKLEAGVAALCRLDALEALCARGQRLTDFPDNAEALLESLQVALREAKQVRAPLLRALTELEAEAVALGSKDAEALEAELQTVLDVYRERVEVWRALPSVQEGFAHKRKAAEVEGASAHPTLRVGELLDEARSFFSQRQAAWRCSKRVRERIEAEVRKLTLEVAKLGTSTQGGGKARVEALGQLRMLQDERERVRVERERREHRLAEVRGERLGLEAPRTWFPRWAVWGTWAGLALGAGGACATLEPDRALEWGLGAGVLGVCAGVVQQVGAFFDRRRMSAHLEVRRGREAEQRRLEVDLENLGRRWEDLERALTGVGSAAGVSPSAVASRVEESLHEAEAETRRMARRQRLNARLEVYAGMLATAVAEESRTRVDRDVAESRVSGLERALGRSASEPVSERVDAVTARQRLLDVRREEEALRADRQAHDAWAAWFVEYAERLGLRGEDGQPESSSIRLAARVRELAATAAGWRHLDERRERLEGELQRADVTCAERDERLHALLSRWGCAEGEAFLRTAEEAAAHREAQRDLAEWVRRIEQTAGMPVGEVRAQFARVGGEGGLRKQIRGLERRYAKAQAKLRKLHNSHGRVKARLQVWGNTERAVSLRARAESLAREAEQLVFRYAVDRVALGLMTRRFREWDREKRPKVIELASETFGRLTGGAYVHLSVEVDDPEEWVVQDARWRASSVEHLEPWATQALHLALRFAALEELSLRSEPLPIVVDELFFGAEAQHLHHGVQVLMRLAERHQVLWVSSDLRVRRVLEAERAKVHELGAAQPRRRTTEPLLVHA